MRVDIDVIRARLCAPFVSASGTVELRELILLRLEDADGHVGLGEAAPLPDYHGVRTEDVHTALEACRTTLMGAAQLDREELLAECARIAGAPQAIAAIDLALWDLEGRRTGQPAWRLLGADEPQPLEVNHTIASTDRSGAAAEALKARRDGFKCVKLKVGIGDDRARLKAVRATAGPEMSIRLDANGAWSVTEAAEALRAFEPTTIELCEEPVRGLEAIAELSALTTVPLAIDEGAANPGALARRACEALCVKIARCGGITGALETARRARAAGYDVYLASTLDGPLGIAAALHVATVIGPARPCGLATLALFEDGDDPFPAREGRIAVPAGPGLGEGLEAWYCARS